MMSCLAARAPMLRAAPGPWLRLSLISLTMSGCAEAYSATIDGVLSVEPLSTTIISISTPIWLRRDSTQFLMCFSSLYAGIIIDAFDNSSQ